MEPLKNDMPLWSFVWERKTWWIILPVLLGCIAFLITPFPPMADWPQHVALGVLLARQDDPAFAQMGEYCVRSFLPYHIFHQMVRVLYEIVGPAWVSRTALLVVFLLYVTGVWAILRVFRAETRLLGLSIPLFFGFLYQMGFAPNQLGIPFFLFCVALAESWRQKMSWQRGLALMGCLLATWLIHPVPFYMAMGVVGILFLLSGNVRQMWWRAVPWMGIPTMVAMFYWWSVQDYNADMLPPNIPEPHLWQKLQQIPLFLMGIAQEKTVDVLLSMLWLVAWVGMWWSSRMSEKSLTLQERITRHALWLFPLVTYFLARHFMWRGLFVYQRFLLFACLLALVLIPPLHSRRQQGWFALGWVTSVAFLVGNLILHGKWAGMVRDVYPLLAKVPEHSVMTSLVPPVKQRLTRELLLRHIHLEFQIYRGGVMRPAFTHIRRMPVVDCRPLAQHELLRLNLSKAPWLFDPWRHGHHATYLLLRSTGNPRSDHSVYPWLLDTRSPYRPLAHQGPWLLLQRKK